MKLLGVHVIGEQATELERGWRRQATVVVFSLVFGGCSVQIFFCNEAHEIFGVVVAST